MSDILTRAQLRPSASQLPISWYFERDIFDRELGTVFFEEGPGPIPDKGLANIADEGLRAGGVLPEGDVRTLYSPLYRYTWESVDAALAAMPAAADGSRRIRYVNPVDGGPVMPTIDCYALRLARGKPTAALRTTATAIAVVIEGEGESRIGDKRKAAPAEPAP